MARTIRRDRRNHAYPASWGGSVWTRDLPSGAFHAPAWFRRGLNQLFRRQANHSLRNAIANGLLEIWLPPIYKRNASWLWW